jgi:hypothetical protein
MIELPGPQFTPRPGWGGQLRQWFREHAALAAFRLSILVTLVLIAHALWFSPSAPPPKPTPSNSPVIQQSLDIDVLPGDGMTNLAARAIDLSIATRSADIRLDAAQHLFAVDTLARSVCWCPVERDQTISFSTAKIGEVIARALQLSPARHAAWARLLH